MTHNHVIGKSSEKVDKLLHWAPAPKYPHHHAAKDLANSFINFFENKIVKIRHELNENYKYNNNIYDISLSSSRFDHIEMISLVELHPILHQLLDCCWKPQIFSVRQIFLIVNLSLETALLPPKIKEAVLKPILKKINLDY